MSTPESKRPQALGDRVMEDLEYERLRGVRDGLVHALVTVRSATHGLTGPGGTYLPPRHHSRKHQAVLDKVTQLDRVSDALIRKLNEVDELIRQAGAVAEPPRAFPCPHCQGCGWGPGEGDCTQCGGTGKVDRNGEAE